MKTLAEVISMNAHDCALLEEMRERKLRQVELADELDDSDKRRQVAVGSQSMAPEDLGGGDP